MSGLKKNLALLSRVELRMISPSVNWINSLPAPEGLLESFQLRGRQSLQLAGLPASSDEDWRFSDLERIKLLFKLPLASRASKFSGFSEQQLPPSSSSDTVRFVVRPGMDSQSLPKGFSYISSNELNRFLGNAIDHSAANDDWSVALNNACAGRVLALRVNGTDLPSLEMVLDNAAGELAATRIVLVLEPKTHLDLQHIVLGNSDSSHSHLLEIYLGKEASLNHGWLALGGGDATCVADLVIQQDLRSEYALTSVQAGWTLSRLHQHVVQLNGFAKTILRGLQCTKAHEEITTNSTVRFDGPEGCLEQLNKAVAIDSSHSIFMGNIDVPRVAQRTNASQLSRNLLLSNKARVDTKPQLTIVADDVKCSHGATVTQLQEEELFYMQSRGIGSIDATQLLLKGYCQDIIKYLQFNDDRSNIIDQLIGRL